jgi:hypothetical protein
MLWVMLRKSHSEQIWSGLPQRATVTADKCRIVGQCHGTITGIAKNSASTPASRYCLFTAFLGSNRAEFRMKTSSELT